MRRLIIAALAAAAAVVPTAAMAGPAAPDVPDAIAVTGPHKPYLVAHAEGVQIYACTAVADGHVWRLLAPRATLTGQNGKVIGSHYAGPRWEAADGSIVAAARDAGNVAEQREIPYSADYVFFKATGS